MQSIKFFWYNKIQMIRFTFLCLPLLLIYYICYPFVAIQYKVADIYNAIDEDINNKLIK